MNMKIRIPALSKNIDMVEVGLARKIIYLMGYKCRRKDDNLLVFDAHKGNDGFGFYAIKGIYPDEAATFSLFVDEGYYTDILMDEFDDNSVLRIHNDRAPPWMEMVSWGAFVNLMYLRYASNVKIDELNFTGSNARTRHYTAEYIKALQTVEMDRFELV